MTDEDAATPAGRTDGRPLTAAALRATYPDYDGQIVDRVEQPARSGETVAPETVLSAPLAGALPFDGLYCHQARAIERLREGDDVVVSTDTASGKTYVYALYFAQLRAQHPNATAVFTYPTRALAGDQLTELNDCYDDLGLDVLVEKYDGDTPANRRHAIRERADVIVTNFAALNVYLSHHPKWRDVFGNCRLVVVDEAHAYTGIQGMHVAWILRRLLRILDRYDSQPQVVCSSATIGNPVEHAQRLAGRQFTLVDEDTSPHGAREIVFWDPPLDDDLDGVDDADDDPMTRLTAKRSANAEASDLLAHLAGNDVQTLLFVRSRQGAEVAAKQTREAAREQLASGHVSVEPYHAGHGKRTRRATENRLKAGDLDGVVSTSALELGIDVGSVDSAVVAGYPGSRQSFWQRVGRAGRGTDDALSVLVARGDAIDRYVLDNPEFLLDDDVEDAVVDLGNDAVYAQHLLCAANEIPLGDDDRRWFGDDGNRLDDGVEMWKDAGRMVGDLDRGVQYTGPPRPESDVNMYATAGEQFEIRTVDDEEIDIEDIHRGRAYRDYHPGALLLHDGVQYEVIELEEDCPNPYVRLQRVSTNEYTRTQYTKEVTDVEPREVVDLGGGFELGYGTGTVNIHYDSYTRHRIGDGATSGLPQPLDLPPLDLYTQLMWVRTPAALERAVVDRIPDGDLLSSDGDLAVGDREYTFLGGLHGAEHAMIKLAPLELDLSKDDLGGLSIRHHPATGGPTWFVHDTVEGGIGFARSMFDHAEAIASRTADRVDACDCDGVRGCPSCLLDHQCGNRNEPLHTTATVEIVEEVLARLS
jgi:DEAD/DEAH box helicase domain-containing protein